MSREITEKCDVSPDNAVSWPSSRTRWKSTLFFWIPQSPE
uniref:Uncharacterized protein n=1 Tax=Klebsiella pneumoniae TaxID=573 RepID=A0A8B0SXK6_KLEPN|nr:hypothetical protein [Klebsiella pneumoniae]